MRRIRLISLFTIPIFTLSHSFAQKKPGNRGLDSGTVNCYIVSALLLEFNYDSIDNVSIKTFQKNKLFNKQIDSFQVIPYWDRQIRSPIGLSWAMDNYRKVASDLDWEIIINDTLMFQITDVSFISVPTRRYVINCYLLSFNINGKNYDDRDITIYKHDYLPIK